MKKFLAALVLSTTPIAASAEVSADLNVCIFAYDFNIKAMAYRQDGRTLPELLQAVDLSFYTIENDATTRRRKAWMRDMAYDAYEVPQAEYRVTGVEIMYEYSHDKFLECLVTMDTGDGE